VYNLKLSQQRAGGQGYRGWRWRQIGSSPWAGRGRSGRAMQANRARAIKYSPNRRVRSRRSGQRVRQQRWRSGRRAPRLRSSSRHR
jgi:hypothetical protein